MKNKPISNFPLSANDQADVIRIFLELREGNRARRVSEATQTDIPLGPHNNSDDSGIPRELLDLD